MLYLIRAHKKQKETRRTTAALEAALNTYETRCRTHAESHRILTEETERILHQLETDAPHDPGNT
ncbi:hypothetical protein ACIRL0_06580 [Streptomyces sp. NPDC102365]|uniref:hypothetical protein n=1 Tax=Streptomyces sp. NPDC102365 TaxID=3366162 RepID=UPI003830FB89